MNQQLDIGYSAVSLFIKREDLLHPLIPGNKLRKLKYNLEHAREQGKNTLLTFGGAFSNHIAAVAAAGKEYGFRTIGVIRGEELAGRETINPTLDFARQCGMQLEFINRENYRAKNLSALRTLDAAGLAQCYILPEGGTNELAVRGCEEVLTEGDKGFDYICCAVGTGGTIAGLVNSADASQKVLGFPALRGTRIGQEVQQYTSGSNWSLIHEYHFGGYAKVTAELVHFINDFRRIHSVALDPVYTAKMAFGVIDMIHRGKFAPGTKILMIHTGGLQGIAGMNKRLKNKHLPLIETDD